MATVADLYSDVETWIGGIGFTTITGGQRDEQYLAPGSSRSTIQTSEIEKVEVGANLTVQIVSFDLQCARRATDGSIAALETAKDAIELLMDDVADPAAFYGLSAIRSTPVIELSFTDSLTLVGDVIYFTLRVECALEV